MNKQHVIDIVTAETGMKKADVAKALDSILNAIMRGVADGSDVNFTHFGTFRYDWAPETVRRNPQTGEPVAVEARGVVRFKAHDRFRNAVRDADVSVVVKKHPKSR